MSQTISKHKKPQKEAQKRENRDGEKPEKQKRGKTDRENNRRIFFLACVFTGVFAAMIGYLTYFMVVQRERIINNPYNVTRLESLASRNIRGAVKTESGEVLAYTEVSEDGTESRIYPYENLFAHTVGYSVRGGMGIELNANFTLLSSHQNLADQIMNRLEGRKNEGDNVITTLDLNLQKAAYEALLNYQGTVIVMEPSTGRVLAMVSKPDFDPNEIAAIWDTLMEDEDSSVLVNRATQGLYPPGSTFKLFTALEYMRENPDSYQDYTYVCEGRYVSEDGHTIHCYNHHAHGTVDFIGAFAYSCNSAFADIGMSLDRDAFSRTLNRLLFNTKLPGAFSCNRSSITMNSGISDYNMMQAAIGQGETLITPMQLCLVTSAIANGGSMMSPYMISYVENCDGSVIKRYSPQAYGALMTQDEAAALTEMMTAVCDYGTARSLSGAAYTCAGKTGSAEYESTSSSGSHAWFTGFAPAENPEIVVTVIIEGAGSGGDYAVPIAKKVFDAYFENNAAENRE